MAALDLFYEFSPKSFLWLFAQTPFFFFIFHGKEKRLQARQDRGFKDAYLNGSDKL